MRKIRHGPSIGGGNLWGLRYRARKTNRKQSNEGFLCRIILSLPHYATETLWKCSNRDRRERPPQKVQECRTERQRRDSHETSNLLLQFDVSQTSSMNLRRPWRTFWRSEAAKIPKWSCLLSYRLFHWCWAEATIARSCKLWPIISLIMLF